MKDIDRIRKILEVANVNAEITVNDDPPDDEGMYFVIDDIIDLTYYSDSKLWEVGYWTVIPGSYWEPEDVDYVKVHETRSLIEAVKYAITSLIDLRLTDIGYAIYPEEEFSF